ncbi:hypothetical protein AV530_004235 [Patagioenas fasciata monilis]|uniref:Uncharacterized protein n=1 Tax=Patagioenas fasciata monilis TaxID=372326 RepID=A0A1V4KA89_PATFA|nr:hypothetical protein AV530_004235 [Patagioenas fasciata monilis]
MIKTQAAKFRIVLQDAVEFPEQPKRRGALPACCSGYSLAEETEPLSSLGRTEQLSINLQTHQILSGEAAT